MKRVAAVCITAALIGLNGMAWAQTSSPQNTEVNPVRLKLAQDVVEASGGTKQAEAALKSLYGTMDAAVGKSLPPEQARVAAAIRENMQRELFKMLPSIIDVSAHAYARELTETELRDLLAWERSPSGQAIIQKQPAILHQVMIEEMPLIMAAMPRIMQKVVDQACDQARCTANDRQVIATAMAQVLPKKAS